MPAISDLTTNQRRALAVLLETRRRVPGNVIAARWHRPLRHQLVTLESLRRHGLVHRTGIPATGFTWQLAGNRPPPTLTGSTHGKDH